MIIYIEPKSSFQPLPSDTLYGAICNALFNIHDNFNEILELLKQSPPFLISSAFPFVVNKNIDHFFPKPIEKAQEIEISKKILTIDEKNKIKKFEKAIYIHESIFNDWINGEVNKEYLIKNINDYCIKDGLIYPKKLDLKFDIASLDIARNSINRQSQFSDIFYSSGYYYKNAGLFFMIKFMNKDYEKKYNTVIQGAVKFLRDRGFGEDVSTGKGHFEIKEFSDREVIRTPEKGSRFISLSRYHPTESEIDAFMKRNDLWYDIFTKRGRSSDGGIRKQVRFFIEGSTFPDLNKMIYGRAIPVGYMAIEFGYAYNIRMNR